MYIFLILIVTLKLGSLNYSIRSNDNLTMDKAICSDIACSDEIIQMLNSHSYKIKFEATNKIIQQFEVMQKNKQQYIKILIEDLSKGIDTKSDDQLLYGLNALNILSSYGNESVAAVPIICKYLNTPLAISAIVALGNIRNDPETSIPALIAASNSLPPDRLLTIVLALEKYETHTQERYDYFIKHLNSDDWVVRLTVRTILFEITGKEVFKDSRKDISDEEIKNIDITKK